MNVAKWVLSVLLMLPFLELAAFIAVAVALGFGWALGLILAVRSPARSYSATSVAIISQACVSP